MRYSKLIVAALATVASAMLAAFIPDSTVTATEWVNVAIVGVATVPTFYVANSVAAPVAKAVVVSSTAVLTLLASLIVGGMTSTEWAQVATAVVGAVLVWAVPNSGAHAACGGVRAA